MEQDFVFALRSLIRKVGLQTIFWGHNFLGLRVSSQPSGDKINFEKSFNACIQDSVLCLQLFK